MTTSEWNIDIRAALADMFNEPPVHGQEIVLWEVEKYWPDGVRKVRFVYYVRAEWREVFPDDSREGSPFTDQWMVYRGHDGNHPEGRIDGWLGLLRGLESPNHDRKKFMTRLAALRAALENALENLARLEEEVVEARDRRRRIADEIVAAEGSP